MSNNDSKNIFGRACQECEKHATIKKNKMKNKITQSIIAGLIATAVMTGFILMAPMMGMPKMNPAEMLSGTMGLPLSAGYLMHFMIGIIFAAGYVYFFNPKVHIHSKFAKGVLFGFLVFIFAQVIMFIMGKIMPMPMAEGSKMLMMFGSLIGHLVFGIVTALMVPAFKIENSKNSFRNANA